MPLFDDRSPISMETWDNSIGKFREALRNDDIEQLCDIYNRNHALIIAYYREVTIKVTKRDGTDVPKTISFTKQMSDLFQLIVIASKKELIKTILRAIWHDNQSMHSNINSLDPYDTQLLLVNVITVSRNIPDFAENFYQKFNDDSILLRLKTILEQRDTDNSYRQAKKIADRLASQIKPQEVTLKTQKKIGFELNPTSQVEAILKKLSIMPQNKRQVGKRKRPTRAAEQSPCGGKRQRTEQAGDVICEKGIAMLEGLHPTMQDDFPVIEQPTSLYLRYPVNLFFTQSKNALTESQEAKLGKFWPDEVAII